MINHQDQTRDLIRGSLEAVGFLELVVPWDLLRMVLWMLAVVLIITTIKVLLKIINNRDQIKVPIKTRDNQVARDQIKVQIKIRDNQAVVAYLERVVPWDQLDLVLWISAVVHTIIIKVQIKIRDNQEVWDQIKVLIKIKDNQVVAAYLERVVLWDQLELEPWILVVAHITTIKVQIKIRDNLVVRDQIKVLIKIRDNQAVAAYLEPEVP